VGFLLQEETGIRLNFLNPGMHSFPPDAEQGDRPFAVVPDEEEYVIDQFHNPWINELMK
jgi:hypothetical protein